jgi:molecular chaperone DnaK
LKAASAGEDAEAIKSKINDLQQAAMKFGEAMYKAQDGESGEAGAEAEASEASNPENSASGDDDGKVVDATFEEVDDSEDKGKKKKAS